MRIQSLSVARLFAFLLCTSAMMHCDIGFRAARAFAANANPNAIALADLNNDGKPDLVSSNGEKINALLSNGDGTFAPVISTATNAFPFSINVGDFNGDGKMDVVAADPTSNRIMLLLGNGDGTFGTPIFINTGPYPSGIFVGDLNGDGKLDLAVATLNSGTISVHLGNGDGTFQVESTFACNSSPSAIIGGDFNGDGKVDLAVANYSQFTVTVLIGNGNGSFQAPVGYSGISGVNSIAVGDFNGDGKLDIAGAAGDTGEVGVLFGKGDGRFQGLALFSAGSSPISVEVADLNKDGKADLVVLNSTSNNVGVLLGNGNGSFQPVVFFGAGSPGFNSGSNQMVITDFDGDGILDLAVVNSGAVISVLTGRGDGTFPAVTHTQVGANPVELIQGDFNSDGKLDFAVVNQGANSAGIFLGDGNGGFTNSNSYPLGATPNAIASADLNGDNKLDLVITNRDDDSVSVLLGNGDGTFQPRVTYPVGSKPSAVAIADLNNDKKLDLIVLNETPDVPGNSGTISVLLGHGDGSFNAASQTALFSAGPVSLAIADLDGDGNLDIAVANALNNVLRILLGRGDGGFKSLALTATGTGGRSVVAVDMNNDLLPDLVVGDFDGVKVLINNGNGTFQPAAIYAAGLPLVVSSGDFNMDGRPDILALSMSNSVALLLNNGDGTLKPALHFASSSGPAAVASGDFNNDGALDAVVANANMNSVGMYLNGMGTVLSVASSNGVSVYNQPVQISTNILSLPKGHFKPTGTIIIRDGNVQLLSQSLDDTGTASIMTSALSVGTHNITASYSGDSNFMPRTSAVFPQVVNRASILIGLQSTPNPAISGNAVNLTATLSPQFGGLPSGIVAFNDGTSLLQSKAVSGSLQVSVSDSSIAFGQRTLTASYPGDTNYSAALSQPLIQNISSQASFSPAGLTFGPGIVGRRSATSAITLSNVGGTALTISSIITSPSFTQSNTCGASLASLQSCTINVSFLPTSPGNVNGILQINDNAAGPPQTISLAGTGVDFTLSLSRSARPSRSSLGANSLTTVAVAVRGELPSAVLLTCSGAPSGSRCNITPSEVNESNASTSVQVTLVPDEGKTLNAGRYSLMLQARIGDQTQTIPAIVEIPSNALSYQRAKRLVERKLRP